MAKTDHTLLRSAIVACLGGILSTAPPLPAQAQGSEGPRIDVDTRELTRSGSAARWAARGASVGALGGALLGASSTKLCEYDPCNGVLESSIGGALVGAAFGAVAGGAIGLVGWQPGSASEIPMPGTGRSRGSLILGLPDGLESSGYLSCTLPRTTTSVQARLGRSFGAQFDGFVEASRIRFEDNGCEGQEGISPDPGTVEDRASSVSLLTGVSRPLFGNERVMLDVLAGVARTSRFTQPVSRGGRSTGTAVTATGYGLHLGAGLRSGWDPGFGGSIRMGLSLRGDWIASSPMGSVPMLTLGIGVWR